MSSLSKHFDAGNVSTEVTRPPQETIAYRDLDGDIASSLVLYASSWRRQVSIPVNSTPTELVLGVAEGQELDLPETAAALSITTTGTDSGVVLVEYISKQGFGRLAVIQWADAGDFEPAKPVDAIRVTSAVVVGGKESFADPIVVKIGGVEQGTITNEHGLLASGSLFIPRGQLFDFRYYTVQYDSVAAAIAFEFDVTFLRPAGSEEAPFETVVPASFRRITLPARGSVPAASVNPPQGIASFDPAWQYPGQSKPGWYVTGPIDFRVRASTSSGSAEAGVTMRGRRGLVAGADQDPHPELVPWVQQIEQARKQRQASPLIPRIVP